MKEREHSKLLIICQKEDSTIGIFGSTVGYR